MNIEEKLQTITDNMPRIFDYGKSEGIKEGRDYMWEVVQQGGNRKDYTCAFYLWDIEYIRPKYKVTPTEIYSLNQTFTKSKVKKVEKEYYDFSQKTYSANTNAGVYYTFSTCSNLEEIEDIGIPLVPNYIYAFGWCSKLHTIGSPLKCDETTSWNGAFESCANLQNFTIDGKIGVKNFNVKWSKKLTKDTILSVLKALSLDITATTTVTFSTVHQTTIETDPDCKPYYDAAKAAGWSFVYA